MAYDGNEVLRANPFGDPTFRADIKTDPDKTDTLLVAYHVSTLLGAHLSDQNWYVAPSEETRARIEENNPELYAGFVKKAEEIVYGPSGGSESIAEVIPLQRPASDEEFAVSA